MYDLPSVGSLLKVKKGFSSGESDFTVSKPVSVNEICIVIDFFKEEADYPGHLEKWTLVLLFTNGIISWRYNWQPIKNYVVLLNGS